MKCIHGSTRPGPCSQCDDVEIRRLPVVHLFSNWPEPPPSEPGYVKDFKCPDCGSTVTVHSQKPLPTDLAFYCTTGH